MNEKLNKILELYHKNFEDENNHYSEYEASDIEYFVGCMLYNHFKFTMSLGTMKTMDIGYDFLESSKKVYLEVNALFKEIKFDNEKESVEFIVNFITDSLAKYPANEQYLILRLQNHILSLEERYQSGAMPQSVNFDQKKDEKKIENPQDKIKEIQAMLKNKKGK